MSGGASATLGLETAWRFALREIRGGLKGFRIFIAAIALGVAAIAAVGSTTQAITAGIGAEGRSILGGDVAFNFGATPPDDEELHWIGAQGLTSSLVMVNSMVRLADDSQTALVRIKAVDEAYPLVGTVRLDDGISLAAALAPDAAGRLGVAVEPILMDRLGLKLGDPIGIGRGQLHIGGVIAEEPDKAGSGLAFGPRVMMTDEALKATEIIQPGSLVQYATRLLLPAGTSDDRVSVVAESAKAAFPKSAWRITTRLDAAPGLERNVERFAQFLTLVGLTALGVGGVGVTNAVKSYLDRKRDSIATLKALGAPGSFVVTVYLLQIMAIAAVGVVIGLLLGLVPPWLGGDALARALDLPIRIGIYPAQLLIAAVFGVLTAFTFAIWTLGRAHDVPVSALFRERVAPGRHWPRLIYMALTAAGALLLAGAAVAGAADRFVAVVFVGALAAVFLTLAAVSRAIVWVAGRLPAPRSAELRLALRNIHRPGGLTLSVVLSLGLGLTLMVTLALIDGGLRQQLSSTLPERAPNFFVLDIAGSEAQAFRQLTEAAVPGTKLESVPMLRGRITALRGVPIDKIEAPEGARWALDGDRGITFADSLPKNSILGSGAWWAKDYQGEPLVSFEDKLATDLGLKIGDLITVSVLGREITARIANTRRVEWESLSINFVMVFSPNAFTGAPFSDLSTVTLPGGGDRASEAAFMKATIAAYPTATVVRVKDVLTSVNDLVGSLVIAIRAAASVALVASVLVLAGALASGHRQRVYDAVLLKTFGATRRRIILAFALEYGLLGLVTAVFALIAGTAAAEGVLAGIMKISVTHDPWVAISAVGLSLVLTIGLGLAGTWATLGAKAAPVLRNL
ncbi:ABC transporter permease [Oryzibacter oryziterrae]|uniref:ABC transporter permease n=1 Tax=Oryzibacter oryziterrae TaxID=2766474 RepID=UPI001F02ED44|nr:FtsX-like permease family protein [Oryzibacter oryziterrae]